MKGYKSYAGKRSYKGWCKPSYMIGRSPKATIPDEDDEEDEKHVEPATYEKLRDKGKKPIEYDEKIDVKVPKEYNLLLVKKVDLKIPQNTQAHHTNEYDITEIGQSPTKKESLVVRRGQDFEINLDLNRPYDKKTDDLRLIFTFGFRPKLTDGSFVEFILSAKDKPSEWGASITAQKNKTLSLKVNAAPSCPVGKWKLKIEVLKKLDTENSVYRFWCPTKIYILFNPWCKGDQVYMPETKLLNEYVLNPTGKIYAGNHRRISPKPWVFGQFSTVVLDCSVRLMNKSGLSVQERGNPIAVSRKISKMVNSADDDGVLTGNWSGDYSDGRSPLDWTGSAEILEQFYKTREPVRFGQCWVFSGVATTVCRALGIPARSVTNFSSAHDTDCSITIDCYFDASGNSIPEMEMDSIWNFHVWNDVWMARPDLPAGYGGWQAIDATPQETSDGVFCTGPVSLMAVKRGEVSLPYDGKFVFGEVNADKVYWRVNEDGSMEEIYKVEHSVGKCISTKKPEGNFSWSDYSHDIDGDRQDITNEYKFKEDSEEERAAVRLANLKSAKPGIYGTGAEDVTFELVAKDNTFMGEDIEVVLKIANTSKSKRTLGGKLSLSTMYYTGVHYQPVDCLDMNGTALKAEECKEIKLTTPSDKYLESLIDHAMCRISTMVWVEETKQTMAKVDELRLRKPHLTIKAPKTGKVGEKFKVEVSFVNTLPVTLTVCELSVEGPGLQAPVTYKQKNVEGKKTFNANFEMTPAKAGCREIIIYFNSKQISAVTGSHIITIQK